MVEISPEVEQQLASMSDGEWAALSAKVRAPDSTEALREAAAQHLSGDALDSFVNFADVSKFVDTDGKVDQQKLAGHLRAAGLITGGQQANYGQGSAKGGPGLQPGDGGRVELNKRYGTPLDDLTASMTAPFPGGPGSAGRAALARRFPQTQQKDQ